MKWGQGRNDSLLLPSLLFEQVNGLPVHLFNEDGFLLQVDMDGRVVLNAFDPVIGVEVFMKGDLENGCTSLPR